MAQNEPFLLARFEPKYLALTDRNDWHKTNRFIQQLNETGKIAYDFWDEIPTHFAHVQLGEFVIMPNHIHGILILINSLQCNESTGQCNESTGQCNEPTGQSNEPTGQSNESTGQSNESTRQGNESISSKNQFMADISPKSGSVSTIIRSFKSACTKQINRNNLELNFGWQSRFHDHIIRNHGEYIRIENYIKNNPGNWKEDKNHTL